MRTLLPLVLVLITFPVAGLAQEQAANAPTAPPRLADILTEAREIQPLETLIVARDGEIIAEEGFRGHSTRAPTNIKSASKSVISALVGIAIDKGVLEGPDQKVAPLLSRDLPENPDPRLNEVTIGNLLSMQAGLGRTSGPNYGRWISSGNWVRAVLARPFAGDPGGGMLYSTGNTHLLSAILTRKTGRSTRALAEDWLEPLDGFAIASWDRDPQGIYFGGNQMAMSPRSLLAFGELYRNGGKVGETQVLSPGWIETSWQPRTRSVFSGEQYGYGWFISQMGGHDTYYAWGYGGQMLYIVPDLDLTVVMTSAEDNPSARNGHRDLLHALMGEIIGAVEGEGRG
jgi:CubicO group peptidase (beta-lactamase class C family)